MRRRWVSVTLVGVLVAGCGTKVGATGSRDEPSGGASPSAAPTPSPERPSDGTVVLPSWGGDIPMGEPPRVPYMRMEDPREFGDFVLEAPGVSIRVDESRLYDHFVPLGDGWLAVGTFGPKWRRAMVWLDAHGNEVRRTDPAFSSLPYLAESADRSHVVYATYQRDGSFEVVSQPTDGGAALTWRMPGGGDWLGPVGALDDDTAVVDKEYLWVDPQEYPGGVYLLSRGDDPVKVPGLLMASDAAAGLISGTESVTKNGGGSCSVILDTAARSQVLWRTCDYVLGAFSPDGQRVLGLRDANADSDENDSGGSALAVLDARSGEQVSLVTRDATESYLESQHWVRQVVWESTDTVLFDQVHPERDEHRVLRLHVAGGVELAGPPPGPSQGIPFWFNGTRD